MPEDEDRRGRVRDSMQTLMGGVESRIIGIISKQKAEEARRARDEFYAIMSHELRTPLNSIIGFSCILMRKLKDVLSEKDLKSLNTIHQSGEHLLTLIDDLLLLSHIEHGEMKIHRQHFRIDECLNKVVRQTQSLAKKHCTSVDLTPCEEMEYFVDPVRISQVVTNLVSNAIKYSPNATVNVSAILEQVSPYDDLCLVITVQDSGMGIKEEDQERIFHHFTQVDSNSTRRSTGTGIGLFITRELVEMHGGRIDLQSEIGSGSTFTAIFPNIV